MTPQDKAESFVRLLTAHRFAELDAPLCAEQKQVESGVLSETELLHRWPQQYLQRAELIPHALAWTEACPNSYPAHCFMATLQLGVAWQARGIATSDNTSAKQFEVMQAHFDVASRHLRQALKLSSVPTLAIAVGMRISRAGDGDAELDYFDLAQPLLPKSPHLCGLMLWALNPKWGGSVQALTAFFERSKTWSGWSEQDRLQLQVDYLSEMADVCGCSGEAAQAQAYRVQSQNLRPDSDDVLSQQADELATQENYPAAVACVERSIAHCPTAARLEKLARYFEALHQTAPAVAAYERALFWGSGDAATRLIELHRERVGEPAMQERISLWGQHGLAQYASRTMFLLGVICYFDRPRADDKARALQWWQQAAEWGDSTAEGNLGTGMRDLIQDLWFGRGIAKDRAAAQAWLAKLKTLDIDRYAEATAAIHNPWNIVKSWFPRA